MVECYSRPVRERFIASRWSLAYLFRLAFYISVSIAPIYIAYSSGGFWRRSDTFLEQPLALFTKNLIAVGTAADGTRVLQYSTMERFNYLVGYDNVRQPAVKSWSTDTNLDSKPDTWDVNLVFPLQSSDAPIVSFSLFLFFQCSLNQQVNVDFNGIVQLDSASSGVSGNKWTVAGDLQFFQRNPLSRTSSHGTRRNYRWPVVNDSTLITIDDTDLGAIVLNNQARNESLTSNTRGVWSKSAASNFNVSVHLTVPTWSVSYIPGPSEAIKFAWIQWLACFWILWWGLSYVRDFVYDQNIVDTTRVTDGTPLTKLHHF